ncbi:hypothetical protein C1I98_12665 [Spongiactinospora gelatinilytica]|uniref:Uncharacterized protein n=1 Tax=Spongiactinospora gelatinilytica TaxID=2666298 RepID=A0A2W2HFC2_9ACTN|nr:hypothetical protein [Spongiactinospora gelatinilytica]PZG48268.1 hypothetical protein C1I98_12665 [Spongiactinospora gelatinilytica]
MAQAVREAVENLATPSVLALLGDGEGDLTDAAEGALRAIRPRGAADNGTYPRHPSSTDI